MSFLDVKKEPTRRELRVFGLLFALFCGLLGACLLWRGARTAPLVVWAIGAAFLLVYTALPPLRRLAFRAWIRVTFPIGWVVSHAVLALVYFGVLTPIGLLLRLLGRDPLRRRIEPEAATYWVPHRPAEAAGRYFEQF